MASFHITIKTGKKGSAARHSSYIAREGQYAREDKSADLIATGYGNLPPWANGSPRALWSAADKYERSNAAAYREYEVALPVELTAEQNDELVNSYIQESFKGKPYQYAIHCPMASLGAVPQPHAHIMISERLDDQHDREPSQYFRRYNPVHPERGGCRKDNCGRPRGVLGAEVTMRRKHWAGKQNEFLERFGHAVRVDHRSHEERGLTAAPGRHLGQAAVRSMTHGSKSCRPSTPVQHEGAQEK